MCLMCISELFGWFYFYKKFKAYVKNIPKKSHRCPNYFEIVTKNKIKTILPIKDLPQAASF